MKTILRITRWTSFIVFVIPTLMIVMAFVWSGESFIENTSSGKVRLGKNDLKYFEDQTCKLTAEEIVKLPEESFHVLPTSDDPNFSFSQSNVWLWFEVKPQDLPFGAQILQVNNPLLNEVGLYEITGGRPSLMALTGDAHAFNTRPIPHRTFRFPLGVQDEKPHNYLLKINSGGEQLLAPLSIWTKSSLAKRDYQDNLMRGCFFGVILFVLLFTLFLYARLKEKSSLYYVHYNMNLLLLQFALSGYAFQFLWPSSPYLANVATPIFATLSVLALMRFSQYFLQLKQYYPNVNRCFTWLGYVLIGNAALALVWTKTTFFLSVLTINVIALTLNLAIIPVAIAVLRKNFKPAKFFLIGFITLVVTVFGFIATNLGLVRNEFYADYGLLIGSAAEVVLLSFAVVDRFRSFKEQALETLRNINKLEREQNEVLERTVLERTDEIMQQKTVLETQKEEILSSIRYAERIQKNLLPSDAEIQEVFPDSFVFYQPKDIVSGDFYWIGKTKLNGVSGPAHEVSMFAACDCTGHGVPGAMVSVMGCNLLRETAKELPEALPDEMLRAVDARMKNSMSTGENKYASDGMDMVLCAIQHDTMELRMAGANNDVLVWKGTEFTELKGIARPIGARDTERLKDFCTVSIPLSKGDVIYAFTDGFADQFGGEKNKKLKISGLKKMLSEIAHLSMAEQKEKVAAFFRTWKGENEQIDDVCLMAVRV